MPRPTRVHVDGALCLVTCRAMEGTILFQEPRDYETYLALLQEYRQRYGFKLFAYVLLPDHLALCVEPAGGTTVSTFMHALNSRYTKYVIKRHSRTGHVFQERFKLILIEKAPWLLRITGYLHTHPRRSGLTSDIEEYRWSSYPSYLAVSVSDIRYPLKGSGQMVSDIGRGNGEVAEVLETLGRLRPSWTYPLYLQSLSDAEWDVLGMELERPAVGSPAFVALVEQKRKMVASEKGKEPDDSADDVSMSQMNVLSAQSSPNRRHPVGSSTMITMSLAMAFLSLLAALLSAHNVDFLRQTLRVLTEENGQALLALSTNRASGAAVRLVSFSVPQQLGGTTWDIQLKPMVATGSQTAVADRLRFEQDKVASSRLSGAGFPACRYLAKTAQAGTGSWETIQIGPGGETVSWQGQWRGRTMHGLMTRQMPGGAVSTFRFIGMTLGDHRSTSET